MADPRQISRLMEAMLKRAKSGEKPRIEHQSADVPRLKEKVYDDELAAIRRRESITGPTSGWYTPEQLGREYTEMPHLDRDFEVRGLSVEKLSPEAAYHKWADLEADRLGSIEKAPARRTKAAGDPDATFSKPRETKNKTVPLHVGDFDEEIWARRKLMRDKEAAVPLNPGERGALKEIEARNKEWAAAKRPGLAPDEGHIEARTDIPSLESVPSSVQALPDLTGHELEQALYEMMMKKKFRGQRGDNLGPVTSEQSLPESVGRESDLLKEMRKRQAATTKWGREMFALAVEKTTDRYGKEAGKSLSRRLTRKASEATDEE